MVQPSSGRPYRLAREAALAQGRGACSAHRPPARAMRWHPGSAPEERARMTCPSVHVRNRGIGGICGEWAAVTKPSFRDHPELVWAGAPALVVFLVVGRLAGEPGHFGWDAASMSGTGVATVTLAYFTARLASSTSVDVAATRDLAEIERVRFAKEDEPFVVEGARRVGGGMVGVDIVNVGRGPRSTSCGRRTSGWSPAVVSSHRMTVRKLLTRACADGRPRRGFAKWANETPAAWASRRLAAVSSAPTVRCP